MGKITSALVVMILLIMSCSKKVHLDNKVLSDKEYAEAFYKQTSNYTKDTSSISFSIEYEKAQYVNQRKKRNWNTLKESIEDYNLNTVIPFLLDSISIDTIRFYVDSKKPYPNSRKIYAALSSINLNALRSSTLQDSIIYDKDLKMNTRLDDNCLRFREGYFEHRFSDLFTFKIDRKENSQRTYSDHDDDYWNSKIEWISNNRFMKMMADRSWPKPNYDTTIVNIYETTDSSYYYMENKPNSNKYYEGYIVKPISSN